MTYRQAYIQPLLYHATWWGVSLLPGHYLEVTLGHMRCCYLGVHRLYQISWNVIYMWQSSFRSRADNLNLPGNDNFIGSSQHVSRRFPPPQKKWTDNSKLPRNVNTCVPQKCVLHKAWSHLRPSVHVKPQPPAPNSWKKLEHFIRW